MMRGGREKLEKGLSDLGDIQTGNAAARDKKFGRM
jgi:hypothetical protein